jgi:hypothetical protein
MTMLNNPLISWQHLAIAICLSASGTGVNSAYAQTYFATPGAVTYTHVAPNSYRKPLWPGQGFQPGFQMGVTQATYASVSQPVVTYIQPTSASVPIYAPSPSVVPPPPSVAPQESWHGAPVSVSPPSASPVYYSNTTYPQQCDSTGGQSCDWFCNTQKKLRSLYRASHRRSDCKFEYPVVTPSGSPYGYVEPTWNEFWIEAPANAVEPGY